MIAITLGKSRLEPSLACPGADSSKRSDTASVRVAARHRSMRGTPPARATDAPQILRDVGSGPSRVQGVPIRTTLSQIHLQDSDSAVSTPIAAISQNA
jgi:hypothetical protein